MDIMVKWVLSAISAPHTLLVPGNLGQECDKIKELKCTFLTYM
jgi:hypothetical protein